jgi:hypothetical protein
MQAERLVAVAPAVAGPCALLDDDGRDSERFEPRAESNAALAASDDDDVRLACVAERARLLLSILLPARPMLGRAMFGAQGAIEPQRLLVTLDLDGGRQQRPDLSILEADEAIAAKDVGLEG